MSYPDVHDIKHELAVLKNQMAAVKSDLESIRDSLRRRVKVVTLPVYAAKKAAKKH